MNGNKRSFEGLDPVSPQGTFADKKAKTEPNPPRLNPNNAHQIAPEGDLILYTPGESLRGTVADAGDASFLVSSTHMKLASPYFKARLSTRWLSEQAPAAGSWMEVAVYNCSPDTLMLILKIIHGKTQAIPREIPLGELAKFAIAVDYFQCVEAVELAAHMWLRMLKLHVPSYWTPDIPTWIMVSWIFREQDALAQALRVATEKGPGPFPIDGLPIPGVIKGVFIR
ncbi:hypothetical protein N7452_009313 [Penicillium brevicompactum]|uniref:BTB domain-containing protein n=1 Tax=Penicillium brevicompactum TaxID=5074 RepID=A0A9W9UAI8_PENBR|nr:hypothetical protein N7452_009313 [Penicillium brevicompactum]